MAQTTPPTITPPPTAPQRGDRATFSARVDAFLLWLTSAVAQFAAVATNVYNNAVDAFNSASAAAGSRGDSLQYAIESQGYRNAAQDARDTALGYRDAAATSASSASTSATNAANSATALTATSTTSNTIGLGAKTFTVQSGKQFAAGVNVKAVDASNAANAMYGTVTSYSGTTLVISSATTDGSGTMANWNISVIGQRGQQGATGAGKVFTETTLTSGGSWVSDAADFKIILQGPGSGGKQLLGGSSGGYVEKTFRNVPLGTVCTYVQGATGVGTTSTNNNGTDGGDSTFTVPGFGSITAGGGKLQGFVNASTAAQRAGGTATGGDLNIPGSPGSDYAFYDFVASTTAFPRKGGDGAGARLGEGGKAVVPITGITNAQPPQGYGAGGGGASETSVASPLIQNASNGGPGVLRVIR